MAITLTSVSKRYGDAVALDDVSLHVPQGSLTALLGRISAYTGREVNYAWLVGASKLDLTPPAYAWGEAPAVKVPVPGETPLT